MPLALSRGNSWSSRVFAPGFSAVEWLALGMGIIGFSIQILASVFENSSFSIAVRSDMGTLIATIHAASVAALVAAYIFKKEHTETSSPNSAPQMPDSSEAENEKLNRVRRRRESGS
jgi:hypothetical protein